MNQPLTPVGSALAGALGACFSNALVYPLDTVKTRLQALPDTEALPPNAKKPRPSRNPLVLLRRWNMLNMLLKIIKTEGISGTFKGFAANMINTFSMQFAYFFFHSLLRATTLRHLERRAKSTKLSTSSELLLGAGAGALAQIFTIPVAVIATRQQLWTPGTATATSSSTKAGSAPSLFETGRQIVAESGVSGLWTGLKPGLILTANPAITYGVFERIKSTVLSGAREGDRLGVAESFYIGVGSKAIATIVTYPYIFAKVRLQARPSVARHTSPSTSYAEMASHTPASDSAVLSDEKPSAPAPAVNASTTERGAYSLLKAVYKEKGLSGWYQGLTAQILKAALCQGILFVSKDQFEVWTRMIILLLTKFRSRVHVA